ncbi:AMP-binding protein [Lapidilactobacillus salsurivasis]
MTELNDVLQKQLADFPQRPLLKNVAAAAWLTGADVAADVAQLTAAFAAQKIGYQDQIVLTLGNHAVYPELMQALWARGIIAHPLSNTTPVEELVRDWQAHDYAGAIVEPELVAGVSERLGLQPIELHLRSTDSLWLLPNFAKLVFRDVAPTGTVRPTDLALILNTSGTTGKPKRVGLTQQMIINEAHHNVASQQMTAADTVLVTMPLFHINAQVMSVLSMRLAGGKIVIAPKFSASHYWQQLAENEVTWSAVVPTIITILLLNPAANQQYLKYRDQLRLRFVRSSSFALPKDKFSAFQNRFKTKILEGYGLTESASQATINPLDAPKIGSAGKPCGTELMIYRDGQFTNKPQVTGEIALRGDHVITDYLDSHQESFKDGWFLTGDLGYLDQDGYLFINGRSKEMISRGGEKVAPNHVEAVLNELDFIAAVAIVGLPDEIYGEAVTAVVVLREGVDETAATDEIQAYAAKHLARFERPTLIYYQQELPRNSIGKVVRAQLRAQLLESMAGGA